MRLWTLHPKYLDPKGLVALWREGLLAQAVLEGKTVGYQHHPQLRRFKAQPDPIAAVASYLRAVHEEARSRGYRFDATKINRRRTKLRLAETRGQLAYEWRHLQAKLRRRSPEWLHQFRRVAAPEAHPLFRLVPGNVRAWERVDAHAGGAAKPRRARSKTKIVNVPPEG